MMRRTLSAVGVLGVLLTVGAWADGVTHAPFVTVCVRQATPPGIVDSTSKVAEELKRIFSDRGAFRNVMTLTDDERAADVLIDVIVSDVPADGNNPGVVAEAKATLRFGNYRTEMLAHGNTLNPEVCAGSLSERIRQWIKDNETQVLAARKTG